MNEAQREKAAAVLHVKRCTLRILKAIELTREGSRTG